MEWVFWGVTLLATAVFGGFWFWQSMRRRQVMERRIRASFGAEPGNTHLQKDTARLWEIWKSEDPFTVDRQTWSDLGMDEVYLRLDCCESAIGKEYLYAALHRPAGPEEAQRRSRLRRTMEENPETRFALQIQFAHLGRYGRDFEKLLQDPKAVALPAGTAVSCVRGAALDFLFLCCWLGPRAGFVSGSHLFEHRAECGGKAPTGRRFAGTGISDRFLSAGRAGWQNCFSPCAPEVAQEMNAALRPLRGLTGALSSVTCPPPGGDAGTFQEVFGMLTTRDLVLRPGSQTAEPAAETGLPGVPPDGRSGTGHCRCILLRRGSGLVHPHLAAG